MSVGRSRLPKVEGSSPSSPTALCCFALVFSLAARRTAHRRNEERGPEAPLSSGAAGRLHAPACKPDADEAQTEQRERVGLGNVRDAGERGFAEGGAHAHRATEFQAEDIRVDID